MEIEEKSPVQHLYRDLMDSGEAFGAQRWLATLQRMCERFACLMATGASSRELGGGNASSTLLVLEAKSFIVMLNSKNVFSDSLS